MNLHQKKQVQLRRRLRIRKDLLGTSARPRLSLHFSGKHAYAQCIDDTCGQTLVYLSTRSKEAQNAAKVTVERAIAFGKDFGDVVVKANIKQVVFDRGIKRYHGRVKAFADSVRSVGVEF